MRFLAMVDEMAIATRVEALDHQSGLLFKLIVHEFRVETVLIY